MYYNLYLCRLWESIAVARVPGLGREVGVFVVVVAVVACEQTVLLGALIGTLAGCRWCDGWGPGAS